MSFLSEANGSNSPVDIRQSAGIPEESLVTSSTVSSTAWWQLTTDERNSSITLIGCCRTGSIGSSGSDDTTCSMIGSGESESIRLSITGLPVNCCFLIGVEGEGS